MKIKSLLLGSAAAMAAASTAQAADAIVVEPEPVEYVRVCDMYGAGYYYLPGTETCLKLGGYVQLDYFSSHYHDEELQGISSHRVRSRARLNVVAKNETEYGTLHSEIRWYSQVLDGTDSHDTFSSNDDIVDDGVGVWLATMSLAGFRAGYDATNYTIWNTYGGYGFYNAVQSGGYTEASGFLFEYNGSFGDFNYGVGIVDTTQSGAAGQPDVMGGISFNLGDLAIGSSIVYDSSSEGVAYRVRGDWDLASVMGTPFSIGAWWEADDGDTDYRKGHQWGVTARWKLWSNLTLFGGYSEYDADCDVDTWDDVVDRAGFEDTLAGDVAAITSGAVGGTLCPAVKYGDNVEFDEDQWTVGVRWDVTPDLYVQLEHNKLQDSFKFDSDELGSVDNTVSRGRTWLRMRRSF